MNPDEQLMLPRYLYPFGERVGSLDGYAITTIHHPPQQRTLGCLPMLHHFQPSSSGSLMVVSPLVCLERAPIAWRDRGLPSVVASANAMASRTVLW